MFRRLCAAGLVALAAAVAPAAAAGLVEQPVRLPVTIDGTALALDALIVRPDDTARHPLVVLSHGLPASVPASGGAMRPSDLKTQAVAFARRGFVAVSFTRRGIGLSEGNWAEGSGNRCDAMHYLPAVRAGAADIRAVIEAMKADGHVDGRRIVAVGHSAGGFATVALTAAPPAGLVAAVDFAGGRRGGKAPGGGICSEADEIDTFARLGAASRVPMLWIYSDNDKSFAPDLARRFHAAFTGAGGRAEFVAAPAFGDDGHKLFLRSAAIPTWGPWVDAFLQKNGVTGR
jgi:dienelactone hydrolase